MVRALEVKTMARETIKPSSPTPQHLRKFKLSLLDQIMPVEYTSAILFYTGHHPEEASEMSRRLKASLPEALTNFYPLAGVIKDNVSVECNDNGAEFVEARANCPLSDILRQPDHKSLRELLPIEIESPKAGLGPLLLAKVTIFNCGGLAMAFCLSHKIADGCTASFFGKTWAATALDPVVKAKVIHNNNNNNNHHPECVNAASLFPADDTLKPHADVTGPNYVTKRFVFHASKIGQLKAKVTSANVPKPSQVEAIVALIWKCTIKASRSIRGFPRVSVTVHSMNLRMMVSPLLPPDHNNSVGNFVGDFPARTSKKEIELQDLVLQLRKGKDEFRKTGLKNILEKKSLLINNDVVQGDDDAMDFYMYSDLSRLPLYDTDFGRGKPVWVTIPNYMHNMVMLLSTRNGDGIEALVSLSKEDMAVFECDKELLAFAAPNPSALLPLPAEDDLPIQFLA